MRARIIPKFDLCTGCKICELACSFAKEGAYNPRFSRLRIVTRPDGLFAEPIVCIQCDNPACMRVCPVGAISRHPGTHALVLDLERCIDCGLCITYCHLGAVRKNPGADKPTKCDMCGGDPQCVRYCPSGALVLAEVPETYAPAIVQDKIEPATEGSER